MRVVERSTTKRPEDRYQTAAEMQAALTSALEESPRPTFEFWCWAPQHVRRQNSADRSSPSAQRKWSSQSGFAGQPPVKQSHRRHTDTQRDTVGRLNHHRIRHFFPPRSPAWRHWSLAAATVLPTGVCANHLSATIQGRIPTRSRQRKNSASVCSTHCPVRCSIVAVGHRRNPACHRGN